LALIWELQTVWSPLLKTESRGLFQALTAAILSLPLCTFDENGTVLVGNPAREKMVEKPKNTIFSIKRFMGKGLADVRNDLSPAPFRGSPFERCDHPAESLWT
jgi:hypothetical protein